jgi:SOS-response transcriptional repressor LexA
MGDLTRYERELLDTPGEAVLQHVERDLNAVRSYKMVVLLALLRDAPSNTQWSVEWIARGFRDHYLDHLEQLGDCSVLAEATDPEGVPLPKFERLLKSMPLHYLSNTDADFFTSDKKAGVFAVKEEIRPFWRENRFRQLLRERVTYALTRYFQGKGVDLSEYAFNVDAFIQRRSGDAIERDVDEGDDLVTTSLPYYRTLRVAAGAFRNGTADYEEDSIEVQHHGKKLSRHRHFVVRIEGDSMDAGNTPIGDGDLVLLERIDSGHAGSLTAERALAVEYQDVSGDTAYALKQIRKDAEGVYWLRSWNREYPDFQVDTDTCFPIARFLGRVETTR